MSRRLRYFALALSLLLLFSTAQAAEGDTTLFEASPSGMTEIYVDSTAVVGDTLYIVTWEDLYTYKIGDAEPQKTVKLRKEYVYQEDNVVSNEPVPVDSIEAFSAEAPVPVDSIEGATETAPVGNDGGEDSLSYAFSYKDKLHMFSEPSGAIKVLEGEEFVDADIKFELPVNTEGYGLSNYLVSIFEAGDELYALVRVDVDNWDTPLELWIVDPATGKHKVLQTEFPVKGMCAYEPGKLLAWTRPEWGTVAGEYKEEDYYPRLFVIDASTGKTLEGPTMVATTSYNDLCGPVYDAANGVIYFTAQNRLLRKSTLDAEPEVMSYFSRELYQTSSPMALLSGTHVVIPTYEGLHIRNVEAGPATGVALRIANSYMSDAAGAFMRENPDIPLDYVNMDELYGASTEEIAQLIGSGEDAIDIFVATNGTSMRQLLEKGYAMDLSGSEVIMGAMDRMYAPIRDAIMVDGKPMGFPYNVSTDLWVYNKEKFEELGLEYPQTYSEYMDLRERWTNELKDQYPDVSFFPEYSQQTESEYKRQCFYEVLSSYMFENMKADELFQFNTPELIEVLKRVEALPGEYEVEDDQAYSTVVYSSDEQAKALIQTYFYFDDFGLRYGPSTPALIPRISPESDPMISAYLNLYIINPNSANVEQAIKFLEYMAEHGEHSTMLSMYSDFNEPLENEWAVQNVEYAEEELKRVMETEVTEENRSDVEAMIKDAERWVEESKRDLWRISQKTIDAYRALVDETPMVIQGDSFLFSSQAAGQEVNELIERHLKGQLTLEQMVKELDQKLEMIYLEQQ